MVFLTDLARHLSVPTPTMDAVIHIASIVAGEDFAAERARTMDNMGLSGLTRATSGIRPREVMAPTSRAGTRATGPMVRLLGDLGRPTLGPLCPVSVLDEGQPDAALVTHAGPPRRSDRFATCRPDPSR
jgi:hypothetical protein